MIGIPLFLRYLNRMESSIFIITPEVKIPLNEIELTYARSSGPGGQNVNKVNSKAVLRWSIAKSSCLSVFNRNTLLQKLANRVNNDGEIILSSDTFRDQIRNREECFEKLKELITQAMHRPKARKKTKISKSAKRKNTESNRKHSEKKRLRRNFD